MRFEYTLKNYSSFGMPIPDRIWGAPDKYRFGFNGMEMDNEVDGLGNFNTAEFWEYDTRLGRRWNLDPINTPWESLYLSFSNNPIFYIDPKGDFKHKFGALAYKLFHGGGDIERDTKSGEYYVGKQVEYKGEGGGSQYNRTFGWDGSFKPQPLNLKSSWFMNLILFDVGMLSGIYDGASETGTFVWGLATLNKNT